MTRALTLEELAAIRAKGTRLALCCQVVEADGTRTLTTAHDEPLLVDKGTLAGTYTPTRPITGTDVQVSANADVGNLEVTVGLDEIDMTPEQIRAGRFRQVAYTLFLTDWAAPHNVAIVVKRGTVGNVKLLRPLVASFELRELKQYLQQTLIALVSRSCRVDLGSQPGYPGAAACGLNLAPYTLTGTVDYVASRRSFGAIDIEGASSSEVLDGYYAGGLLTWRTGQNAGYAVEVRTHVSVGLLELFEPTPFDIALGDTFTLVPGCDKTRDTCRDKFNNILNFQGEPDAVDLSTLAAEAPA